MVRHVPAGVAATPDAFPPGPPRRGTAGAPDPAPALDLVFIHGFEALTVIGIDADELHTPQTVRLDLTIGVHELRACKTDHIDDTVNYAAVHTALGQLFASHRIKLLEALAEAIADLILGDFHAQWVRVALAKPVKFSNVQAVGVVIERRRAG